MNSIKLKKISDQDNLLGFDEIIILDKQVSRILHHKDLPTPGYIQETMAADIYEYEYLAIADGNTLFTFDEDDMVTIYECYEVV